MSTNRATLHPLDRSVRSLAPQEDSNREAVNDEDGNPLRGFFAGPRPLGLRRQGLQLLIEGGRLRHLRARPAGPRDVLEHRRAKAQGLYPRGDRRPAFLRLLSARSHRHRLARGGTAPRRGAGPLRGRRLAHAQGRHRASGPTSIITAVRERRRRADRLRQDHARPDRAPRATRRSCATARSGSGCWSRACATTPSSCSTRTARCAAGTPARRRSRATRPTRSSAATSASSTRRRTSRPASRRPNCARPGPTAASRTKAGACARTARCSGPTWSSPPSTAAAASCSASPRSRAT